MPPKIIAVIGSGDCAPDSDHARNAYEVGRLLAQQKWTLVTGGHSGVMHAASQGAAEAGGLVIGIIRGDSPRQANPYVTVPIATGMGDARNAIIANTAQAFIAIGGEYGTLSEIAFVLKRNKPLIALGSWPLDGRVKQAQSPQEAVNAITQAVGG